MRVLFLSDVPLTDPASGSEQVLKNQVSRLAKTGIDVCAITRNNSPSAPLIRDVDGVTEAHYGGFRRHYPRLTFSLLYYPHKYLSCFTHQEGFDAVIIHQPGNFFPLALFGKLRNVTKIYVYHSPWHHEYLLSSPGKSGLQQKIAAKVRLLIERFCLQKTHRIITLSSYMKKMLHRTHAVPFDKIEINPGGVDLDSFRPLRNREAEKNIRGFPPGPVHLLTVRNLEPRMGLDLLLICMAILKREKVNVHLCIGGDGPEKVKIKDLIRQLALTDDVTMTGFIPTELLSRYYGAADFFILPTRRLEGFGLVTPESMACGTPVLGTPVGGTKEILANFVPELLFSDTSPEAMATGIQRVIEKYFNDSRRYLKLRNDCRQYAKMNFSWDRHIHQLAESMKTARS
jgi:glycosyltransferase involved in cell wall biosynthesis